MFKQIIFTLTLVFSINGFSFQDATIHKAVSELKGQLLHSQTPEQRLQHFEKFRDFVFDRLQSIPAPKSESEKKEYSELNDFENFILAIDMKKISKETCSHNQNKLVGSFMINNDYDEPEKVVLTSEAKEALSIIESLCQ